MKYGLEGYGLYWYCLELIAAGVDQNNINFELEHDAELISDDTGIHVERVEEMMKYMVQLRLFEESEGRIFCLKMATRTDDYTKKLINQARSVRTKSGQTPDSLPTKSALLEENRTEQNRTDTPYQSRESVSTGTLGGDWADGIT